jgi:hypothetical protein
LKALGFQKDALIYIAAGEIYGGDRRLEPLRAAFPKLVSFFFVKKSVDYNTPCHVMAINLVQFSNIPLFIEISPVFCQHRQQYSN